MSVRMTRPTGLIAIGVPVIAAFLVLVVTGIVIFGSRAPADSLPDVPEVRARDGVAALTLTATTHSTTGHSAWSFNGHAVQPVIRVSPGDVLKIHYVNALSAGTREHCAEGPCMNMTNLHFHGLTVSPMVPQDDVLHALAMPGEALDYTLRIPLDHPPGLDWYHTHPHGESQRQVLDGLSGALVIEGIERYAPQVRTLRERVLVIRGVDIEHDPNGPALRSRVEVQQATCSSGSHEQAERVFTVNDTLRPRIALAPGERQFWRMVNAAADSYVDLQLDRGSFDIVALDGMPLTYHDPRHPMRQVDHVLVPPAGRVEAIVTGASRGEPSALRTRCVDTGPDGDPNPAMILADVDAHVSSPAVLPTGVPTVDARPATYKTPDLETIRSGEPRVVVTFTEDHNGFYINDRKFTPDAAPMVRAKVGGYEHWRIVNATRELHPFHIHQAHFLAYREAGRPVPHPEWLDTVNVPASSSVDVIMDFTDPIIRGMSVFHCHLLNHEDKGMMAKVLFE
jgi:suppressor of ftsI